MKYRKIGLLIMISAFCLVMAQIAGANAVLKTVYVDGAKVGNEATGPQELSYLFNHLTIGCEGSKWYRYNGLKGSLDDFAVYSGLLTGPQIAAHYAANTDQATYEAAVAGSSPLLYLKLQDASSADGATATNSGSSAELSGTYCGAITRVNDRFGNANSAVNLAGAASGSGDCIDVSDGNGVISLPSITVELWVRLDANIVNDYPRFFQHNNGGTKMGSYGGMVSLDTNSIGAIGGGNTIYVVKNDVRDNNWHHVVITYNSIIFASSDLYPPMVLADNPLVYLRFEGDTPAEAVKRIWRCYSIRGGIDQNLPTIVGYGGSNANVESGMKALTEKAGGIGKSIFLDNTRVPHDGDPEQMANDGVVVVSNASGSLGEWSPRFAVIADDVNYTFAKGDITYEFWFKHSPPGRPQMVRPPGDNNNYVGTFFQQIGSYNNEPRAPGMGIDGNNIRILCGVRIPTGDGNETNHWYTGKQLPRTDQDWHQMVVVYDVNGPGDPCNEKPDIGCYNSMTVKFYFDGALYGTKEAIDVNGTSRARLGPYLCALTIGVQNDWGYGYNGIAGYIDEFAVYAGQLDPNRILAHYAAWQPNNCIDAVARGYTMDTDFNDDCMVDFYDFAEFALNWARCNNPADANCSQNW